MAAGALPEAGRFCLTQEVTRGPILSGDCQVDQATGAWQGGGYLSGESHEYRSVWQRLRPGLPYARGRILTSTEDDFRKLQQAWRYMAARLQGQGPEAMFNFSGLEHGLPLSEDELPMASDFMAPALYFDKFKQAALEHFGGSPERHDVALFNRLTGCYVCHAPDARQGRGRRHWGVGQLQPPLGRAGRSARWRHADRYSGPGALPRHTGAREHVWRWWS